MPPPEGMAETRLPTVVPATEPAGPAPLMRNRDYLLLAGGQVVSTLGTTISGIAVPLLILALTGSPAAAGIAGGLSTLPYLVFSLPAGALVDRWDRKRVMVLCDVIRAINAASIPLALVLNVLTIWQLYLVVLIEGTLFVFFNIAEVAALPQVVAKSQLPAASAQNQGTFATANLIGPALGGFLYQSIGRAVPFVFDAVSYAISAAALWGIRTHFQEVREAAPRNLRGEIREGVVWLWHQPLLRIMALVTGLFNFTTAGLGLFIIVAARAQGADEASIGLIFSLGAVGGLAGSALASRLQKRLRFGHVVIGSLWITALIVPAYALIPPLLILGVLSGVFFFVAPIWSVVMISYRLPLIPDALQGRVNSAFRLMAFAFIPAGSALSGVLIEQIGVGPSALFFGVLLALLALAVSFSSTVRNAPRPADL
ncbi:MAG TPA: MFS transporter [Chloroflexia bacterium]|nr:MFS transporter [Chloroflexia bacterium]